MFSDQFLHYFNFFFSIQDRETGISRRSDVSLCKNPLGICVAIIYHLSKFEKIKITQKELGKIARTTETTVRTRYREIKKFLAMNKKNSP